MKWPGKTFKNPLKPVLKLFRRTTVLISLAVTLGSWLLLTLLVFWSIGAWHNYKRGDEPVVWSMVWSNKQARRMNLDIHSDLETTLNEIPFKEIQLTSYWDEVEAVAGIYDFQSLDRQFAIAKSRNVKITLQIGLHQARFPYCHQPDWAKNLSNSPFKDALRRFVEATIDHFDGEINLSGYALEPEIFEAEIGHCQRVLQEQDLGDLYKIADDLTDKELIISRKGNGPKWRSGATKPEVFGIKLNPYPDSEGRHYTPPAHYYSFSAGNTMLLHRQADVVIRELPVEPAAISAEISAGRPAENVKLESDTLSRRLDYARSTNIRKINLKGVEWALWQKYSGDDRFWRIIITSVESDF